MNKKTLKLISLFMSVMLLMSAFPYSGFAVESSAWTGDIPSKASSGATFRFGVVSDAHLAANQTSSNNLSVAMDIFKNLGDVDALAMTGDMVYAPASDKMGSLTKYVYNDSEVNLPADLYNPLKGFIETNGYFTLDGEMSDDGKTFIADTQSSKKPIIYAMGNHEYPENDRTSSSNAAKLRTAASKQLYTEQTGRKPQHVMNVSGYHFITSEQYDFFNDHTVSESAIMAQIEEIEASDSSNKPIFILHHEPIFGTVTGSDSSAKLNTENFKNFLKNHPRVIVLSAHTHATENDPRNIWQDGFTAISTSQLGGGNISKNGAKYTMQSQTYGSQCLMFDLKENASSTDVTIYKLNLGTGELIGTPYTFTVDGTSNLTEPKNETFVYTKARYENPSIAHFDQDGLTINKEARQGFKFTYNVNKVTIEESEDVETLQDNFIFSYRVVLKNKNANAISQNFKVFADFYRAKSKQLSSYAVTLPNQLDRGTTYELSVYPLTPFTASVSVEKLDELGVTPVKYEFTTSNEITNTDRTLVYSHESMNVALNKTVKTGNPNHSEADRKSLTDGSTSTFLHASDGSNTDGTYIPENVTLPSGKEVACASGQTNDWLIVDLGKRYNISEIKLWARQSSYNVVHMRDFEIQVSNDEEFSSYTTIASIVKDFDSCDYKQPLVVLGDGNYYRYVRIKKTGNTAYGFSELQVFTDIRTQEVSRNRSTDHSYANPDTFVSKYMVDGKVHSSTNCWLIQSSSAANGEPPYVAVVDLERDYPISMLEMFARTSSDSADSRRNWKIYGFTSEDGMPVIDDEEEIDLSNGTLIYTIGSTAYPVAGLKLPLDAKDNKFRYLAFAKTVNQVAGISEIRAHVAMAEVMSAERTGDNTVFVKFAEKMNIDSLNKEGALTLTAEDGSVYTPSEVTLASPVTDWDGGYDAVMTFDETIPSNGITLTIDSNVETVNGENFFEDTEIPVTGKRLEISKSYKVSLSNINIAKGKTVYAGNKNQTNASYLVDEKTTTSVMPGDYTSGTVTLPGGTLADAATSNADDWYVIDLEKRYIIKNVEVYPDSDAEEYNTQSMSNFAIEVSDNIESGAWKELGRIGTENAPQDAQTPATIAGDGYAYRYVRIRKTAASDYLFGEVKVLTDLTTTNVSRGKETAASSNSGSSYLPKNAVDGKITTAWAKYSNPPVINNFIVDLGDDYPVQFVHLYGRPNYEATFSQKIVSYGFSNNDANSMLAELQKSSTDTLTQMSAFTATKYDKLSKYSTGYLFDTGSGVNEKGSGSSSAKGKLHQFAEGNYRYLTFSKTNQSVVWLSEVHALVVNPQAYSAVANNDNTLTVKFTDKIEPATLKASNFAIDGVTLSNPRINEGFDGGYEVTFDYSGQIANGMTLTVDESVRTVKGIEMIADCSLKIEADVIKVTRDGEYAESLVADEAHSITATYMPDANVTAELYVAVKKADGTLVSCVKSEATALTSGKANVITVDGVTPKVGEKVFAYLWEKDTNKPIIKDVAFSE